MPKVSVIVPNYNHAQYLKRRIESILNQTYQDFEIIFVDDCSTDSSFDIFMSYKDHPKVSQIVKTEKNSGSPYIPWEKGLSLSKGEFIWFAEADDWCEHTLLETLVEPLLKNDSIALSFCQSLLIDETGCILYRTKSDYYEKIVSGRDFVVRELFGDTILVNAGMILYRKLTLKEVDDQFKTIKGGGDWMFWVQIALQGNVFVTGRTLNYCARHQGTVTSKSESQGLDIEGGNQIFQYVLKHTNPSNEEIKNALKQRINIFFEQKNAYANKDIRKQSLKSVLSLDKKAKRLYLRKILKRYLKKYILF